MQVYPDNWIFSTQNAALMSDFTNWSSLHGLETGIYKGIRIF